MRKPYFIPLLLLASMWALGCTSSETSPPVIPTVTGGTTGGMSMMQCTSDNECAGVCVGGLCIAGQCNIDKTCAGGSTCDRTTYQCVANDTQSECMNDDNCAVGFCIANTCRDVQCVRDENCNDGMRCDNMRCVTVASCIDGDGDQFGQNCPRGPDCDDGNAMRNPGMTEDSNTLCDDGIDHDCNGVDAVCGAEDVDGDGFSDKEGDCDDNNRNINPNAMEVYYNGIDEDCDSMTNDADQDGDGFAAEQVGGPDCDDLNDMINPVAQDISGNGIDEDCDGSDRMETNEDRDGDGVSELEGDCNDDNENISPARMEVPYNSLDDDCNAETRDNDLDEDGFNYPRDCDDSDEDVNPNATEVYYNNIDDDCKPGTNDDDADGDGFIAQTEGGNDCNDDAPTINPGEEEDRYNGVDDDCDPSTRDDDIDEDGFDREADCNDDVAAINPDATETADPADGTCGNDIDENCDNVVVDCNVDAVDTDNDGVPDDQDCAPMNMNIPGPEEIINNGLDDDCDPNTPDMVAPCDNDAFDEAGANNTSTTATAISDGNTRGVQFGDLVLCNGEQDWYQIVVEAGDGLEIDVTFDDAEGDIDVAMYRLANGRIEDVTSNFVDSSSSINNWETVYTRRATSRDTYFIKVYPFGPDRRQAYGLTANVFERCYDDAKSLSGEHNDTRDQAKNFPPPAEDRQICDYDDDWFKFNHDRRKDLRVDVLFSHAGGDIDVRLYREGETSPIAGAHGLSITDDEVFTVEDLDAGDYNLRVYGVGRATNNYRVFRSSGTIERISVNDGEDRPIPDATEEEPGLLNTTPVDFQGVPAGAIVRSLRVKQIDVNHKCLGDIQVTLKWDGQDVVTLWNRDGDGCLDGQEDDDGASLAGFGCLGGVASANWNGRLGNDFCLLDRVYREFSGLDAQGDLTVQIKDFVNNGDDGELVDFNVELEYYVP
jgi:hypothetical protein